MEDARDWDLSQVHLLLEQRAGLDSESLGARNIELAVQKRMAACGTDSPQEYLRRLSFDAAELQQLLEDLVVPETWFFRDPAIYAYLTAELENRRKGAGEVFRVLSVPCSTGEETYSIAMILRHAGLDSDALCILGVDLSARSIACAEVGQYTNRSFRELGESFAALRSRWCEQIEGSWRVRDELRWCVRFCSGNLASADFLAGERPFDAVFCRNLLIYFHAEARRTALRNLMRLLKPHGVFVCAPAEARLAESAGFRLVDSRRPCVFRAQIEAIAAPRGGGARQRSRAGTRAGPVDGSPVAPSKLPPARKSLRHRETRRLPEGQTVDFQRGTGSQGITEPELLQVAKNAADEGRLEQADAVCGQVLAGNPFSTVALFLRGVIRQAQGELSEAQQCFEKVLYLDPRHYETLVHLTLLAEQRGEKLAAENYRRRVRECTSKEAL